MKKRTKNDIIDDIAVIMKQDRSLAFFAKLSRWRTDWLNDLLLIIKDKNILTVDINREEERELCEQCSHYQKTEFGMWWCNACRKRVDDYQNEKFPGELQPTFENTGEPQINIKYECTDFEKEF